MQHRREHGLGVDRLPHDALALITDKLPFQQRLVFLSCCSATRAFHKSQREQEVAEGGSVLWPKLGVSLWGPEETELIHAWLALNNKQLHSLYLDFSPPRSYYSPPAEQGCQAPPEPAALELVQPSSALLQSLSGSGVRRLRLRSRDLKLDIGGRLLQALPHLQSFSVKGRQVGAGPGLSRLSALTSLTLCGEGFSPPADVLPASLQELKMRFFDAAAVSALRMPAGGLPHLRSLVLAEPRTGSLQVKWLAACPHLTQLRLEACHMDSLPKGLTTLTALQDLSLSSNRLRGGVQELAPLSTLQQLTRLDLSFIWTEHVPAAILSLPALQVRLDEEVLLDGLCVSWGQPTPDTPDSHCAAIATGRSRCWCLEFGAPAKFQPRPHSLQDLIITGSGIQPNLPWRSTSLTGLLLSDAALFMSLDHVTGLSALRILVLAESKDPEFGFEEVCELLDYLARLPRFEELVVGYHFMDPEPFAMARELMEAEGGLRFKVIILTEDGAEAAAGFEGDGDNVWADDYGNAVDWRSKH